MARGNELTIVLNLDDKASKEVAAALKNIGGEADKAGQKGKDAGEKSNASWLKLTITIASIIKAYRMASNAIADTIKVGRDMDREFDRTFKEFETSVLRVQQTIATALIPSIKTALEFWTELLNKNFDGNTFNEWNKDLTAAVKNVENLTERQRQLQAEVNQKLNNPSMFNPEIVAQRQRELELIKDTIAQERVRIGVLQGMVKTHQDERDVLAERNIKLKEARDALEEFKRQQTDLNLLFVSGAMSSQEYYNALLALQDQSIARNQQQMDMLQQLANVSREANDMELQDARNKVNEYVELEKFRMEQHRIATQGMAALTVTLGKSIQTNLSGALTNVITGVASAKEAFQELGKQVIQTIVQFMVQKAVAFALEKTMLAGTVAAAIPAGAAVAAAWAPAALAANIASFGGAGVAAATSTGIARGALAAAMLSVATLGKASALGSGAGLAEGTDTVPVMLSPGEMVFPRTMADAIRAGDISVSGRGTEDRLAGGISITINTNSIGSMQDARILAEEIGQEIERAGRFARGF